MEYEDYKKGVVIVWAITFLISWVVCSFNYGFLWGFGFGWVPSLILGFFVGIIWPLIVLIGMGLILIGLIKSS